MLQFAFDFMPQQLAKSRKLITSITHPAEAPYSRNISLITISSQPVSHSIPIQNFPNLEIRSFLAFNLTESSKASILESLSEQDEEKTISLSEESSQFTLHIGFDSLTADLSSVQNLPEMRFDSQSVEFSNKENIFYLASQIPLCSQFRLERFKADFEGEHFHLANADKFYRELLKLEMMTRGVEFCFDERGIMFEEELPNGEGVKVQVEIWVENRIFRYMIRVKRRVEEDWKNSVGHVLRNINESDCSGVYGIDEYFFYATSFYPHSVISENMGSYLFAQRLIERLVFQYKYFYNLARKSIERNQKTLGNYITVHKILDSDDYLKEKQIINFFQTSQDVYFKSRFLFHLITFQEDFSVIYYKRPSPQPFFEFSQEQPLDTLNSIFTLIEKLGQIGLRFKDNKFPLNQFAWYEEKPTYNYSQPLSSILEPNTSSTPSKNPKSPDSITQECILKTKENFFQALITFSNDSLASNKTTFTYQESLSLLENSETIELDEDFDERLARLRIELFESNKFKFFREYRGILQVAGKSFLLCSAGFDADLRQRIVESYEDLEGFYEFLSMFLQEFVEKLGKILTKNSNFACFDTSCIGFSNDGLIMIEAKAREEVDESFTAPEVLKGRSSRLSLIYSFGKVLEAVFCLVVCLKLDLENEEDARGKVFEQFHGLREIVDGCTERFLPRRWDIEKVQEKVVELIGNFPKC